MPIPLCVYSDPDTSFLYTTGQMTEQCVGYVLMTSADYAGAMTLSQLFGWPDPLVFGGIFTTCLGIVLGFAAWANAVGVVASMFNTSNDEEL
jgi:hypothetical protein